MYSVNTNDKFFTEAANSTHHGWIPVKTLETDDSSEQWKSQEDAVAGAIDFVRVVNGGMGYSETDVLSIDGDGEGAAADLVIGDGGVIKRVDVTRRGRGYTHANTSIASASNTAAASLEIHPPPPGGHGSDPVYELNSNHVMVVVDLDGRTSMNISTNNDFRTVSLVADPVYRDGVDRNQTTFDLTTRLRIRSVDGNSLRDAYLNTDTDGIHWANTGPDAVVGSARGRIVDFTPGDNDAEGVLRLSDVRGRFSNTQYVTVPEPGEGDGRVVNVLEVTEPDIEFNSGHVLFVQNRTPISRSRTQTERVKLVFGF